MANLKTIVSVSITAGLLSAGMAHAADSNPFQSQALEKGFMLADNHMEKGGEGMMGDKKADGKCGADKKADGKCGADKKADGKCGSDKKMKDGKCGGDKTKAMSTDKKKDGKCGEGKCGANKTAPAK